MKPMLAFKLQDHKKKIRFPCYIQPKLNGVRMLFQAGHCQSRDEHLWPIQQFTHIREALAHLPDDVILDGELYVHGWSLQKINSFCSVHPNCTPKPNAHELIYNIFDCFFPLHPLRSFAERTHWIQSTLAHLPAPISVVPTHRVTAPLEAEELYTHYRQLSYEGTMYRDSESPYGTQLSCGNKENRWTCLLKRKDWQDAEFEIVDYELTVGKHGEQGFKLTCKTESGRTFSVGSGLSHVEMRDYVLAPPIGKFARVRYLALSDQGVPTQLTLEAIL